MDDKLALRASQAGMRLIAQLTIYNSGKFERLHQFISESYHPDLLEQEQVAQRVEVFRERYEAMGKLRVHQVIGTSQHHVVLLLKAQQDGEFYLTELKVEEDYPHRITAYSHSALS